MGGEAMEVRADWAVEMGEALVVSRGGQPAGVVAAAPGEESGIRAALEVAGYVVGAEEEPERIRLDKECTVEDKEPCKVATALGVAAEVAAELGLPSNGTLRTIVDSGVVSITEARAVLAQWAQEVRSAPAADEDALGWAEVVESEVFTPEPGTTKG